MYFYIKLIIIIIIQKKKKKTLIDIADNKTRIFYLRDFFGKWKESYKLKLTHIRNEQLSETLNTKKILNKYFTIWNKSKN